MVRARSQHPRGLPAVRRLGRSARRFLRALDHPGAELSILVVGDRAMRRINRQWRGVDRATDVLSFPAAPQPGDAAGLGDLVISLDTARRRARLDERPLAAELDRYLAHGLLHLLGFDHERPGQARRMAAREEELLRGEGMVAQAQSGGDRGRSPLLRSRRSRRPPAPAGDAPKAQPPRSGSRSRSRS